jgi:hypothetical protein
MGHPWNVSSCLNDIGTYMTHILGYIMFHIHIYASINISFCVATVSNRPSGLDSIVLSQSFLVLDDGQGNALTGSGFFFDRLL